MDKHYIIINSQGENCGFYVTGLWKYDDILKRVKSDQHIKEISTELWNALLGNTPDVVMKAPKVKLNKINDFLNTDFLAKDFDLKSVFFNLFEEKTQLQVPHVPSQIEQDVKFLAETLMKILEPMTLPGDGEPNPGIVRLGEIIKRYS